MSTQTYSEEIRQLCRIISKSLERLTGDGSLALDHHAAGYRLERKNGSQFIGPRAKRKEWIAWANGFVDGLHEAEAAIARNKQ